MLRISSAESHGRGCWRTPRGAGRGWLREACVHVWQYCGDRKCSSNAVKEHERSKCKVLWRCSCCDSRVR